MYVFLRLYGDRRRFSVLLSRAEVDSLVITVCLALSRATKNHPLLMANGFLLVL